MAWINGRGRRAKRAGTGDIIGAVDIGTTAIRCCIACKTKIDGLHAVGVGQQCATGIRHGSIVDMDSAAEAVRRAVQAAEDSAGVTLKDVIINVSSGYLESHFVAIELRPSRQKVSKLDLRNAHDQVFCRYESAMGKVVHVVPIEYILDDSRDIQDPVGMFAERFVVRFHVVTTASGPLKNLHSCIERCHLDVADCVVSPFAAGLGSLSDDECEQGVTLIDMGGGTTGIAMFVQGKLRHVDMITVGGNHVTKDLASCLSTSMANAERLKVLYGSAIENESDSRETIDVPPLTSEDGANGVAARPEPVARSRVTQIIHARVAETLEIVRSRLAASGFDRMPHRSVVLTGGASQLPGMREITAQILNVDARMGAPNGIEGSESIHVSPGFTTCTGLLAFGASRSSRSVARRTPESTSTHGRLGRFGQWIREHT